MEGAWAVEAVGSVMVSELTRLGHDATAPRPFGRTLRASAANARAKHRCCNDRMKHPALPPIFVSHGSPMIALEPGAAGAFLQTLGPAIDAEFGRPTAILAVSAHTTARAPVLLAAARACEAALAGTPTEGWPWVRLLVVFATIYVTFGVVAFGPLLEEA